MYLYIYIIGSCQTWMFAARQFHELSRQLTIECLYWIWLSYNFICKQHKTFVTIIFIRILSRHCCFQIDGKHLLSSYFCDFSVFLDSFVWQIVQNLKIVFSISLHVFLVQSLNVFFAKKKTQNQRSSCKITKIGHIHNLIRAVFLKISLADLQLHFLTSNECSN